MPYKECCNGHILIKWHVGAYKEVIPCPVCRERRDMAELMTNEYRRGYSDGLNTMKHRCGGNLKSAAVNLTFNDTHLLVEGLKCDTCGEELVTKSVERMMTKLLANREPAP